MRFRMNLLRSLAFRSLAPLLGLSALMAGTMTAMAASADRSAGPQPDARTLARLFRSVADLVTPATELRVARHGSSRPSAHAVLSISALAETHLCRSLWMLSGATPASAPARHPRL